MLRRTEEGELEGGLKEGFALRHIPREALHARAVDEHSYSLGGDNADGGEDGWVAEG